MKQQQEVDNLSLSMKHLNWRLKFKDSQRQEEFVDYYKRQQCTRVLLLVNIYFSFFLWPSSILAMYFNRTWGQWVYSSISFLLNTLAFIGGWSVYYEEKLPKILNAWKSTIRTILIITYMIFIVFGCIRNVFTSCDQIDHTAQNFVFGWHCADEDNDGSILPIYALPLLVITPIVIMICFREVRLDMMLCISILANAVFIMFVIMFAFDITYIVSTIFFMFITLALLIDIHLFHIHNFLRYKQLQEILADNKQMVEENRASELRNMIGNLAHDLKTPLASFMSGIDIMEHSLHYLAETLKIMHEQTDLPLLGNKQPSLQPHQQQPSQLIMQTQLRKSLTNLGMRNSFDFVSTSTSAASTVLVSLQSHVDLLTSCFTNVRNTNIFMLMMINRSIDYAKASKGLKLSPRNETIDLMETLSLPLQCMKNIQERVSIELEPIDRNICSHIITDKQWLQENILCLLSNAVKYSNDGNVSISVCLTNRQGRHWSNSSIQNGGSIKELAGARLLSKLSLLSSSVSSNGSTNNQRRDKSDILLFSRNLFTSPSKMKLFPEIQIHENIQSDQAPKNGIDEENRLPNKELLARQFSQPVNINSNNGGGETEQLFIRIEIADHGVGIAEEVMKNLFLPFQKAQRLTGGTGKHTFILSFLIIFYLLLF